MLNGRHVLTLWWAANLIAEHGGEQATIPTNTAPHWPDRDGEIHYREADLNHLARNSFIELDREGPGITLRFGSRTKALVKTYREHWSAA